MDPTTRSAVYPDGETGQKEYHNPMFHWRKG